MKNRVFAFLVWFPLISLVGCRKPAPIMPVDEQIISQSHNQDKSRLVQILERDGGATTDFATIVKLTDVSKHPNRDEDVFVAKGRIHVNAVWASRFSLEIDYDCYEPSVFRKQIDFAGVKISYKGK